MNIYRSLKTFSQNKYKNQTEKWHDVVVSISHAFITFIISKVYLDIVNQHKISDKSIYLYLIFVINSSLYYCHDLYNNKLFSALTVHHILTLMAFFLNFPFPNGQYLMIKGLHIIEKSNFALYGSQLLLKGENKKYWKESEMIKVILLLEVLTYGYFRIFAIWHVLVKYVYIADDVTTIIAIIIYIGGLFWTFSLSKITYKYFKNNKNIYKNRDV